MNVIINMKKGHEIYSDNYDIVHVAGFIEKEKRKRKEKPWHRLHR